MNEDFIQVKTEEEETLKRKQRRIDLAQGIEDISFNSQLQFDQSCDLPEEELSNDVTSYSPKEDSNIAGESCPRSVRTRSEDVNRISETFEVSTVSRGTQTDISGESVTFLQLDTKVKCKRNKEAHLICPSILEAIVECETVCRSSLDSAIRSLYTVANRVFMQNWKLPLSLDDEYLSDKKLLKNSNY